MMIFTPQKPSKTTQSNIIKYQESQLSKNDLVYLGSIDSKNIDAFRKQATAGFTDVRPQKLLVKTDATIQFTKVDRLSSLESHRRRNSSLAYLEDLDITLARINELQEDEEEDEYGEIIKPTEYATKKAIELVSKAAKSISKRFFKAWVSTEDSGGVSFTWSKPDFQKEVRLVIPPTLERKIYLYHEKGAEYGVEYNVSAKTLSHWLTWCNSK